MSPSTTQQIPAASRRQTLVIAWFKIVFGGSSLFLMLSMAKDYL
jgi:hypothetical protein